MQKNNKSFREQFAIIFAPFRKTSFWVGFIGTAVVVGLLESLNLA